MRFVVLADCTGFPGRSTCTRPCASRAGPASRRGPGSGVPMVAGFLLLRNERLAFRARTIAALHGEQSAAARALRQRPQGAGRRSCFLLPGVISDVLALRAARVAAQRRRARLDGRSRARSAAATPIDGESAGASTEPRASACSRVAGHRPARAPCRRARHTPTTIITMPAAIIGSDSHWPIVRPSASEAEEAVGLAREFGDEAAGRRSRSGTAPTPRRSAAAGACRATARRTAAAPRARTGRAATDAAASASDLRKHHRPRHVGGTRPHSSPLMKLPRRPAASPSGTSGATKSVTSSQRLSRRRANNHSASSTPRKPPWKLMPPCQTARISSGCAR